MNAGRIEHRAAKVSLVTGLSTVLTIAFQLISVPVCLKYWGETTYGSWLALFSAFMLIRSLDTGYTVYVGNEINRLYHQSTDALRSHLASAITGIAVISAVQIVLVGGTLAFDTFAGVLGMPTLPRHHTDATQAPWGLVILTMSWILTGSYLGIVHRLLVPAGLMYQAAWWAMALQVSQFCAIMAAALLQLDLLQTSLLFAVSQFVIYVASAVYVRCMLPAYSPWLRGRDARLGLRDLRRSALLTVSTLVQQGSANGVVLVIAALAGPAAVPAFTTVRTLTNLWTAVTTVLTGPLLPDVVRIHARGETQKLVTMNAAYWVLIGTAVNAGALLSYPLMPFLYGQWTGHAMPLDSALLCLMLATVVVANAGALLSLHLNGINRLSVVFAGSVARAALGLGLGALAYPRLGIASFGLGMLTGESIATLLTTHHFFKHEVLGRGLPVRMAGFGPVSLSLAATLIFFIGAGSQGWSSPAALVIALTSVAAAGVWGWQRLDDSLKSRLKDSAIRRSS